MEISDFLPLIDTDTIYSFLNRSNKYHEDASNLLQKINKGKLIAQISCVSLIELSFIYIFHKIEDEIDKDMGYLQSIKNLEWVALNIKNYLTGLVLYKTHKISFFNSLHAGIAINLDSIIISQNTDFDLISGLKRKLLSDF